ncbi:MAG: YHS domain-containing protein [Planctomycetota bacterium]|jgi:YHS domain-containing protein
MRCKVVLTLAAAAVLLPALALAAEGDGGKAGEETKVQTTCPLMGGKINKEIYADHEGKRVYFCCKGCIPAFKKDPAKYVKKLEDSGVVLDKVCKCGAVKGTEACKKACAPKPGAKCGCGNAKGSEECKKACAAKKSASAAPKAKSCCPH